MSKRFVVGFVLLNECAQWFEKAIQVVSFCWQTLDWLLSRPKVTREELEKRILKPILFPGVGSIPTHWIFSRVTKHRKSRGRAYPRL
jgi:hypothetical protein